jgi:hypothetical protein
VQERGARLNVLVLMKIFGGSWELEGIDALQIGSASLIEYSSELVKACINNTSIWPKAKGGNCRGAGSLRPQGVQLTRPRWT